MSKKLTLSELHARKQELAKEIRTQADAYDLRRKEEKDAWPAETRATWESTNKLYDENEQLILEAQKDDEVSSRVEKLRQDEEQSRRSGRKPGLDDKLPGEERTYGDAGLDRDGAAELAQRQRDAQLVFRSWMMRGAADRGHFTITDEMRDAAERVGERRGNEIMVSLPATRSFKVLQRQFAAMSPEERQLAAESGEFRALSKVTATTGPELVPQSFINMLMVSMLAYGDMLNYVETITTQTGETINWPVADDTANEGAWVAVEGEDTQVIGEPNPAFGRLTWGANELHSKWIKVPIALNEDSMFDLEMLLAQMLGERLGRSINRASTVGTGTGQNKGITLDAPLGNTTALATAISTDDIVKLEHSVDPAYRNESQYMFHDSILQYLRLLKDTQGRQLWQASMREGVPDMLNGRRYVYNQHMANTVATTNLTMLFGRLRDYKLRLVRGVRILRADERFIEKLQIGFMGYIRVDGKLLRPSANAQVTVKKLVQA